MPFCSIAIAGAIPFATFLLFCLTDGAIRRALRFSLARRLGGAFTPTLIVVGDSLAAACPWKRLFRRPFPVLNLAVGGATVKEIAGQVVASRDIRARWLLIDGGLNDLLFDTAAPEQIEADFRALFRRIGADKKVIVTLMPFIADAGEAARIEAANLILLRLCGERGYAVIDINPAVSKDGVRRPEMTGDGLHFTAAAETVWLDAVGRILRA